MKSEYEQWQDEINGAKRRGFPWLLPSICLIVVMIAVEFLKR